MKEGIQDEKMKITCSQNESVKLIVDRDSSGPEKQKHPTPFKKICSQITRLPS